MYFYNLEGTVIVKYEVKISVNKLKQIRKQIIDNCSRIVHKSYETTNLPIFLRSLCIKNYSSVNTGKKDLETNKDIYLVSYDLYNSPYLVKLIDQLLMGNTGVINEIKNYKEIFSVEETGIVEEYEKLLSSINSEEDVKIYGTQNTQKNKSDRIYLLKKMENLLNSYQNEKLTNYKISETDKYRLEVLDCIKLKPLRKISLEKLIQVQCFFDKYNDKELCNDLQKILKKGN